MTEAIDTRLKRLGITLPSAPAPRGNYVGLVVQGGIAYVSGQVSRTDVATIRGPVDANTPPAVIEAATRACTVRALAVLAEAPGGLDAVDQILFVRGFVHAVPSFEGHSTLMDGVSRLLLDVFAQRGRHARSAIGASSLPSGGLLEIEIMAALVSDVSACR